MAGIGAEDTGVAAFGGARESGSDSALARRSTAILTTPTVVAIAGSGS